MALGSIVPGRQQRGGVYAPWERDFLFKSGTGAFTGQGFGPTSGARMPQPGQPMGPAGNRMNSQMPWGNAPATTTPPTTGQLPGGGPGMGIQTSIQPGRLYDDWMTQFGQNQLRAEAAEASNPAFLAKEFDKAGQSRDAGTWGLIAPKMASIRAAGDAGAGNLQLDDALSNAKHQLAGEIARSGEAVGLGNLSLGLQESGSRFRNNQIGRIFSLFDLLGG